MKKILFVVPSITRNNGVITFIYNYIKNKQLSNSFEFSIFSSDKYHEDVVEMLKSLGVNIYFHPENFKKIKKYISSIKGFYKENKFDIVHFNVATTAYFHIKYLKKYSKNSKIIMHSHATKFSSSKLKSIIGSMLYKLISNSIDYRFACSKAAGKHLFNNKDFTLIYNALSNEAVKKGLNLRKKYGISDESICVGLIGRVSEQKNPFYVFDLANRLINNYFFIIGDGNLLSNMKQYALKNNIKNVIFMGSVDNAKELYYNFDFIIMPSLYEGLPLVALEAQQQGIFTVLSTNITNEVSISNYVKFIDLNDLDGWIEILSTKTNYEFKFNSEFDNYNIDKQAKKLKDIYMNILGDSNGR